MSRTTAYDLRTPQSKRNQADKLWLVLIGVFTSYHLSHHEACHARNPAQGTRFRVARLLAAYRATAERPVRGWLRAVREGVGLSQREVATKAGVKQQAVVQWEDREAKRAITIGSLERAANAMNCELVYFLVPRPTMASSFAEIAIATDPTEAHRRATSHSMILEGQAVEPVPASDAFPPPPPSGQHRQTTLELSCERGGPLSWRG